MAAYLVLELPKRRIGEPAVCDGTALTDALAKRRSVRDYSGREISTSSSCSCYGRHRRSTIHPDYARRHTAAVPLNSLRAYRRGRWLPDSIAVNSGYRVDQHGLELVVRRETSYGYSKTLRVKAAMGQTQWVSDSAAVLVIPTQTTHLVSAPPESLTANAANARVAYRSRACCAE